MIKTIQNWLDVRKQYKLEQQRQELINVAKVIISDIMRELVKYSFSFRYASYDGITRAECSLEWTYCTKTGFINSDLDLCIFPNFIEIKLNEMKIATYEHLKWYQLFTKKSTKKKFYHAEDAVKAISNMIIMGEAL